VPYLSARNTGVLELFDEGTEIECFEPGNAQDLASKIRALMADDTQRNFLGKGMKDKYTRTCAQTILARDFLKVLGELIE
jgi:glycosyltransferase involved in cell wall biosynthesis